ncbi:MAG: DEAD/DEAH box helicase [Candidatus Ancillula sp.]|nr:DEAD/DEAH box helicase [Candidatus Ancillula sp.]
MVKNLDAISKEVALIVQFQGMANHIDEVGIWGLHNSSEVRLGIGFKDKKDKNQTEEIFKTDNFFNWQTHQSQNSARNKITIIPPNQDLALKVLSNSIHKQSKLNWQITKFVDLTNVEDLDLFNKINNAINEGIPLVNVDTTPCKFVKNLIPKFTTISKKNEVNFETWLESESGEIFGKSKSHIRWIKKISKNGLAFVVQLPNNSSNLKPQFMTVLGNISKDFEIKDPKYFSYLISGSGTYNLENDSEEIFILKSDLLSFSESIDFSSPDNSFLPEQRSLPKFVFYVHKNNEVLSNSDFKVYVQYKYGKDVLNLPPVAPVYIDIAENNKFGSLPNFIYNIPYIQIRNLNAEKEIINQIINKTSDIIKEHLSDNNLLSDTLQEMRYFIKRDDIFLSDIELASFLHYLAKPLSQLSNVNLIIDNDIPEYEEINGDIEIDIDVEDENSKSSINESSDTDWFNLNIAISVNGNRLPLASVITALKEQKKYLITENGKIVQIKDNPKLSKLSKLLEEAVKLSDKHGKISKYNMDLVNEISEISANQSLALAWTQATKNLLEFSKNLSSSKIQLAKLPKLAKYKLRDYQLRGYTWLTFLYEHHFGGILADDMGLGKTIQSLSLVAKLKETQKENYKPFLIVAPASVVPNWISEIRKFTPWLKATVKEKSEKADGKKISDLINQNDIVILSYSIFRLEANKIDQIAKYGTEENHNLKIGGIILDEAQMVKNAKSKASTALRQSNIPFKLAITGTPIENNVDELWSIFAITSPGLFGNLKDFKELYTHKINTKFPKKQFEYEYSWNRSTGNYTRKKIDKSKEIILRKQKALTQLRRRISPFFLRRTKEEVTPELPSKNEQILNIELNSKHRKAYDVRLQRERMKILHLITDDEQMNKSRFEVLSSLTKLRQMSLAPVLVDPSLKNISSSKIETLIEMLNDIIPAGHKCLIFSQFTGFLNLIKTELDNNKFKYSYLDGATKNRATVIKNFKEGSNQLFLISLKAGGFGLNLTEADYVFLMDPWWNPAVENQAIDRTHRIGQDKKVMVYRMVALNTIEEKVMELKAKKQRTFDAVLGNSDDFTGVIDSDTIKELLN